MKNFNTNAAAILSDRRTAAKTPAFLAATPGARDRLLASSILTGGTLRTIAAAAGMMTALGVSPAFAQCYSTATGLAGNCTAIVPARHRRYCDRI